MSGVRGESGQVLALSLLALTVLLGMSALVLDVGSWYRVQRKFQATADAAALAGAQLLPEDPSAASQVALTYADRNADGAGQASVSVGTGVVANDEITVAEQGEAPSFFARVFNLSSVQVAARATARSSNVVSARYVAPIAVSEQHPMLQCLPRPCFDQATEIALANLKDPNGSTAAGNFGLIDLDGTSNGTPGLSTLANWVSNGFEGVLGPGLYEGAPGADFNAAPFSTALDARIGSELLFPVYRSIELSGSNARFDVIGWVGFTLTSYSAQGNSGTLFGHFTRLTWDGVAADGPGQPDFGVRTISLVR